MANKPIKITFKTLTPLWTGDAWGENREIRPSSIMGSLRFWFEVICYFAKITGDRNYENGKLKDDLKSDEFKGKLLKYGANFEGLDKALANWKISLPSRVFGCTGWKGWVGVKRIEPIEDYCFGNKLNLPFGVAVKKDDNNIKIFQVKNEYNDFINQNYSGSWRKKQKEFRKEYSIWYFANPYFYGQFTVTFEVEEKILEPIFYPLLAFIEKYGFLGGKWNIGYGRVKVEKIQIKENKEFKHYSNWRQEKFGFSKFYKDKKDKFSNEKEIFSSFLQDTSNWGDLENNKSKVIYLKKHNMKQNTYKDIIKELIKIKSEKRFNLKSSRKNNMDDEFRHEIYGTVKKGKKEKIDVPQGSKIIPWIYEENGQMKGGFVSIAGILNMGGN